MSLFGLLGAGASGLRAQGYGMAVSSQNAQNAGTDGYSRRDVRMWPIEPPPDGGGGVRTRGSRRVMDRFIERRLLGATSARAEARARQDSLRVLDRVLAEVEGGVTSSLDEFEVALSELSGRPGDAGVRQSVLSSVERLSLAFNNAASEIDATRADIDDQLEDEVTGINQTLRVIGELGIQIQRSEVDGREASDLRDQRDQMVRELSQKLPIRTIEEPNGAMSVLLAGGLALVSPDGRASSLSTETDPGTGNIRITRMTSGQSQDVTGLMSSGTIGGLVSARDGALSDAKDALDQLAFDIASAYNTVHSAGFGADGVGGRNLFEPIGAVAGAADRLAVSADVRGQPDAVAAAADPLLASGDNRNALDLGALADASFGLGGTATAQAALGALVGQAGHAMRGASLDADFADNAARQLETMRASVSGVSVDEEMISLARYQRGYEASLRVVQAADEMLRELVNLGR